MDRPHIVFCIMGRSLTKHRRQLVFEKDEGKETQEKILEPVNPTGATGVLEGVAAPVRIGNIYGEQFGTGYAGNVWDKEAICPTLMTMQGGNRQPLIMEEEKSLPKTLLNYRIRKLTPKECWRLQAFPDSSVEAAIKAKISNSQLYKMAGNAICVDCLYYIFKELYAVMPYLFDDMTVGSFFSGIGSFECALNKLQAEVNENTQPLINAESSDKDDDAFCIAMRGRYNEDGKVEQHLEPRFDGVTNTITTVQKDNLVAVCDNSPVMD